MKVTMARTCSLRLLCLYPRAWRERYADEVAAVLEEQPVSFMTLFDLFVGMLDAYVHSDLFTERKFVMAQRLRSSQMTIYFSAVFFSIVLLLYFSESDFFWYPDLAYQRGYHLASEFIYFSALLLVLTTVLGSLVFSAFVLKQLLAGRGEQLTGFFIRGLAGVIGLAILRYMLYQLVVPTGSSEAVAHLSLNIPAISTLPAIFGSEICVALVFVGLKQVLIQISERCIKACILWVAGMFAPIVLLVISYRLVPSYLGTTSFIEGILLISLVVFGSVFIFVQRKRTIEPFARPRHFFFIPTVLMTFSMSAIMFTMLGLTIHMHLSISDFRLMRYSILGSIVLVMALLTIISYISLWRGFKAQRALI